MAFFDWDSQVPVFRCHLWGWQKSPMSDVRKVPSSIGKTSKVMPQFWWTDWTVDKDPSWPINSPIWKSWPSFVFDSVEPQLIHQLLSAFIRQSFTICHNLYISKQHYFRCTIFLYLSFCTPNPQLWQIHVEYTCIHTPLVVALYPGIWFFQHPAFPPRFFPQDMLMYSALQRKKALRKTKLFTCTCERCAGRRGCHGETGRPREFQWFGQMVWRACEIKTF